MNHLAIILIKIYQNSLGLVMPGRCRFYPTCSAYAVECFENLGFLRALAKSSWRILRCNPLSKGYEDPVHTTGAEKSTTGNLHNHEHTVHCNHEAHSH